MFGIEIEAKSRTASREDVADALTAAGIDAAVEGYNHTRRGHWKVVTDASVTGGFELVSPPLPYGEESWQKIEVVCGVLASLGVKVDRQCGLHVHHDASRLDLNGFKNLARLWVKYEGAADRIMPPSRRGNVNAYCRSNRDMMGGMTAGFRTIAAATSVDQLINAVCFSRYVKLNMQSYWRHGTVEFRQHSGTIEAEKIIAWVKLTANLMQIAAESKRVNDRGIDKLENLVAMAPDRETRAYYRARSRDLAG